MTDPPTIHLGVSGRAASIVLLSRSLPEAADDWSRDAIEARIAVEADPFRGEFPTTLWSHELVVLQRLMAELYARVGNPEHAVFALREYTLRLEFILTAAGSLVVNVQVRPAPAALVGLQYSFGADQSYPPLWIAEIEQVLAAFPLQMPAPAPRDPLHVD